MTRELEEVKQAKIENGQDLLQYNSEVKMLQRENRVLTEKFKGKAKAMREYRR